MLPIEVNIFYYSQCQVPFLVHWISPSHPEGSCLGIRNQPTATLLSLRASSSTTMLSDTYPWTDKEIFHPYHLGHMGFTYASKNRFSSLKSY